MPIKRGSIVRVTSINELARVTRVSNHPVPRIHWISLTGGTKGYSSPHKLVEAPDPASKPDETVARWSLGPAKVGPQMREGHHISSILYLDGRKVGFIADEGDGGAIVVRATSSVEQQLMNDVEAWGFKFCPQDPEPLARWVEWWQTARPIGKDAATFCKEWDALVRWSDPGTSKGAS